MFNAKDYGRTKSSLVFAKEVDKTPDKNVDCPDRYEDVCEMIFKNPQQYIDVKIRMLRDDMCIKLTKEEIAHLNELKTRNDIDRAVRALIERHL